jgi:hypothetical protein
VTSATTLSSGQREKLQQWLRETGELCVDVYIPKSGSSGTGYFLRSIMELEELISKQAASTLAITIFRRLQYPLRGMANESMLGEALKLFPDGKWYTIISLDDYYPSEHRLSGSGDTQAELLKEFAEVIGQRIAIGVNPFDENDDWIYRSPDEAMVLYFNRRGDRYEIESVIPNV